MALATALLGSHSAVRANDSFEHKVVMNMTSSYSDDALKARNQAGKFITPGYAVDSNEWTVETTKNSQLVSSASYYEYGTKIVKEKISNKEILQFLIEEGEIQGPLKGWSIVLHTNNDDYAIEFYAKRGNDLYSLDISFFTGAEASKDSYSFSGVDKYNAQEELVSEVVTEKSSFNAVIAASAEWNIIEGQTMELSGLLTESWTGKYVGKGEDRRFIETPGALKFTCLVGEVSGSDDSEDDEDEDEEWTDLIEGSWSASAGIMLPAVN